MASKPGLVFSLCAVAGALSLVPVASAQLPPGQQEPTIPSSSREVSEDPVLKVPPATPNAALKRKSGTMLTVLYVRDAKAGSGSARIVRVSATAAPPTPGGQASISYDRFLGPLTMKSLGQILETTTSVNKGWPTGESVRLTYSEQPAPVELDAASLAGSLVLDSMIRDWDPEPRFAALGSMQSNGEIGALGAMTDRLYAAGRGIARLVVPAKNETQVADFLLSQGITAFVGTQIFTAATMDDARTLATTTLDADTKEMIELFGAVQRTLAGSGANAVPLLRGEHVQGTLKRVLEKAPNHLSAKVLYDWGTGKRTTMSLDGSIDFIDRGAADLIRSMRASRQQEALAIPKQALNDNVARLRFVYERLDPQAQAYAGALFKLGEVIQRAVGMSSRPPTKLAASLQKDLDTAREQAAAEWTKMAQARINSPAPGEEAK